MLLLMLRWLAAMLFYAAEPPPLMLPMPLIRHGMITPLLDDVTLRRYAFAATDAEATMLSAADARC